MRRDQFVMTRNVQALMRAIGGLKDRGAEEACLIVVDGEPGLGKTFAAMRMAAQGGWPYVRAKTGWTPTWELRELLEAMGLVPEHSYQKMYRQAVEALHLRAVQAAREERDFAVVIDEVDHIARSRTLMEAFRDLSDLVEVPFVFVGMGRIGNAMTRYQQIGSRVGATVRFERASLEDVRAFVDTLCEVEVGDDLLAFLHQESGGLLRECKEAVANIERFGRRHGGGPIGRAEMAGETLMYDRKTGAAIRVRAA
ncbi:AAA family ATPase [Roseospirillum parvum]|uniref:AAA domain-containing protein n=1 Tax=Roseospirillum parvum TaxID=83401 RepID=A0A1G8G797_9PROT|nr:ATP-binding protein [Roseospirillum parvum]SDH90170.1 AAA domain-containing protein [Roseospirillum parvum]